MLLRLFVMTYDEEGAGEPKQLPIYAITHKAAEDDAIDWLLNHPSCNYQALHSMPDAGAVLDGKHYPGTKEVNHHE